MNFITSNFYYLTGKDSNKNIIYAGFTGHNVPCWSTSIEKAFRFKTNDLNHYVFKNTCSGQITDYYGIKISDVKFIPVREILEFNE